jgi:electron transfer flavoprotein beta subunit
MSDITVLVGASTHAVSGRATRSRADATAVALALGLPGQLRLLNAGAMPEAVARDYLALGARRLEVLETGKDEDVATSLLPAVRNTPWILTGTRGESEQGSGVLPFALGAALGRPVVTDVVAVQADGDSWIVTQALPKGARRRLRVSAPAVLAISAAAPVTLRHSLADAMAGTVVRTAAPSTAPTGLPATGQRVPRGKRRKLLEAHVVQSGHARMLGAIESPSTGGAVLQAGTPKAKAQAVLDYLQAHSLVQF